jgi:hypothetical protein
LVIYEPLKIGVSLKAIASDLVGFHWQTNAIAADFILPGRDKELLRVAFGRECIVRLLDEMPLSTEDDPVLRQGMAKDHFAYRVSGAPFSRRQSPSWLEIMAPVSHYQFVTGWACMDVLSPASPTFEIIERPSDAAK